MTRFSDHKSRFLSSGTTLADPIKPDVKRPERGVIVGALAIAIFVFDGDAPDFVEVGEAGIAVDDAMRRQRRVQLVG